MKKFFSERQGELLISSVVFLITICCFKLVIDDYSFFASNLAARQFCDFLYFDFHFQGYIGVREIYKVFYYLFPRINWHFVFSVLTEFIGLYLVLRAIRKTAMAKVNSVFLITVIQITFAVFYIEDITFISHTRVSLIFCGVAVFNLAFMKDIKWRDIILYSLLFVYGLLLRPESSMGTLLLVAGGLLLYSFNIKAFIKRLWIPMLAILTFLVVFIIDWNVTNIYVRKIEPEIEYKIMAGRVVDIGQMKTARDSVKYMAAMKGMWFDTKELSPAFLRSILLPGSDFSYKHSRQVFVHVMEFYGYYIFIDFALIALLVAALLLFYERKRAIFNIAAFILFTFAVIYALDYNGLLLCSRHFVNLQFVSLFVLCFYFFNELPFKQVKHLKSITALTLLFLLSGLSINIARYKEENTGVDQQVEAMVRTTKKFESIYTNRIVAVTIDGRFMFDQHFRLTNHSYTKNTYLLFDWFTFGVTPRYVDYMNRTCNCDAANPAAFFRWLAAKHALYIASPYRFHLTEEYMRTVYKCNLVFDNPERVNDLAGVQDDDTRDAEIRTVRILPDTVRQN